MIPCMADPAFSIQTEDPQISGLTASSTRLVLLGIGSRGYGVRPLSSRPAKAARGRPGGPVEAFATGRSLSKIVPAVLGNGGGHRTRRKVIEVHPRRPTLTLDV